MNDRLTCEMLAIKSQYGKEHGIYRPRFISSICVNLAVFENKLDTAYLIIKMFKY